MISTPITEEISNSYLNYSMSVIIGRAIPDVRDGLKPVHRRILYSMHDMGLRYNTPHRKSARVVGEVIGRFHPHGDMSIYNAMVRMGQDFSLRCPLVDGQGNFGSIDGDPPAAYRYTEARMSQIASEMLVDIEKETVPFDPNFDETDKEPKYLPARIPNLLINGSSGIAVGMSTSIPPYNLGEIIDAILAMLEGELSLTELAKIVKGPDFPTGGKIMGQKSILDSYRTGRGTITIRAKMDLEEKGNKRTIVVTEIPYMVNKAQMVKDIYDKVNDGLIKGITSINDESSRHGLRIVIALSQKASFKLVKNKLLSQSRLQTTFRITNLVLDDGQPKVMNMKALLQNFIRHRDDIIVKRTNYNLRKAKERLHIIEGLLIALDNIDEIIKIIRNSPKPDDAKQKLVVKFKLSEIQAEHILNMRLRRLTALEQQSLKDEKAKLDDLVKEYQKLLDSKDERKRVIKEELLEIKDKYKKFIPRRTEIVPIDEDKLEIKEEDLIKEEDVAVILTQSGYIKRIPLSLYETQKRGGKGKRAMKVREDDVIKDVFIASTHNYLLILTNTGRLYWLKVYEIPEGSRTSKGKPIESMVSLKPEESLSTVVQVEDFSDDEFLIMATKKGVIKKCKLSLFSNIRESGIIAISLKEDDVVIGAKITTGEHEIVIGTKNGMASRYNESDIRPTGRTSMGVKAINLKENDEVIGMVTVEEKAEMNLLTVTKKGYGKRTRFGDYRKIRRGGIGVKNIDTKLRNDEVIYIKSISDEDEILLVSKLGNMVRLKATSINILGRTAAGHIIMRFKEDEDELVGLGLVDL
ncbi:MAG: DNA gyrase subunit A [Candidatus Hodarchaeota archaeon]